VKKYVYRSKIRYYVAVFDRYRGKRDD